MGNTAQSARHHRGHRWVLRFNTIRNVFFVYLFYEPVAKYLVAHWYFCFYFLIIYFICFNYSFYNCTQYVGSPFWFTFCSVAVPLLFHVYNSTIKKCHFLEIGVNCQKHHYLSVWTTTCDTWKRYLCSTTWFYFV